MSDDSRRNKVQRRLIGLSFVIVFSGLIILWAGCGGAKNGRIEEQIPDKPSGNSAPDWFTGKLPTSPDYFYGTGTATSKDVGTALTEAKHMGLQDVAKQVAVKIEALFKRFRQEVGVGEDARLDALTTAISKEVVSEVIRGCSPVKQDWHPISSFEYRGYALMRMPIGLASVALRKKIIAGTSTKLDKATKELYTRVRASQAFEELEEEVEKYEDFTKGQLEIQQGQ